MKSCSKQVNEVTKKLRQTHLFRREWLKEKEVKEIKINSQATKAGRVSEINFGSRGCGKLLSDKTNFFSLHSGFGMQTCFRKKKHESYQDRLVCFMFTIVSNSEWCGVKVKGVLVTLVSELLVRNELN